MRCSRSQTISRTVGGTHRSFVLARLLGRPIPAHVGDVTAEKHDVRSTETDSRDVTLLFHASQYATRLRFRPAGHIGYLRLFHAPVVGNQQPENPLLVGLDRRPPCGECCRIPLPTGYQPSGRCEQFVHPLYPVTSSTVKQQGEHADENGTRSEERSDAERRNVDTEQQHRCHGYGGYAIIRIAPTRRKDHSSRRFNEDLFIIDRSFIHRRLNSYCPVVAVTI